MMNISILMRLMFVDIKEKYEQYKNMRLNLHMERGWPSVDQLELSMPMLDTVTSRTNLIHEVDYRSYAGTGGIIPLKMIFAEMLKVNVDEVYIGGTMSTTIMYDIVNKAMLWGLRGETPWKDVKEVSFICPVPGYEKHFKICETFGIKMINVPLQDDGPDIDMIEKLVKESANIKGIWCVPLYSNPTGIIYSDEKIKRLAHMSTAAKDFTIFWDNAYVIHHLTDNEPELLNIIRETEEAGYPHRVFEFTSTSKITFPGGGVAVCVSSIENIEWLKKNSLLQLKSGDKVNQYRHYLFFKDLAGFKSHMIKHKNIIVKKFKIVDEILRREFGLSDLVKWKLPQGGYFVGVYLPKGFASKVYKLCKDIGVYITPAGSVFPYNKDVDDSFIRIAPTYLSCDDLRTSMEVFCCAVKCVDKLTK